MKNSAFEALDEPSGRAEHGEAPFWRAIDLIDLDAKTILRALLVIYREVMQLCEFELRRFSQALHDFLYPLMKDGLPRDWRGQLRRFLDEWDAEGFVVAEEDRDGLEIFVESRAVMDGLMPVEEEDEDEDEPRIDKNDFGAHGDRAMLESILAESMEMDFEMAARGEYAEREWWTYPARKAPIKSVEDRKGLGAWYDEAVATGQHDPGFFERTAVSVVRAFFPDSTPTKVVTRANNKVEVTMGGGPTSGGMGQQAAAIAGMAGSIVQGRMAKEVVETVVDTTVQEATGSPVAPSATLSRSDRLPKSKVPTINGRKPINSRYAGQIHPSGVKFKETGFPDFTPHAKAQVELDGLTGNYAKDAALANKAVRLKSTPKGYIWHHVEDGRTMQLVSKDLHNAVRHTGGSAVIKNGGLD